ncbi:MAG: hypothetical protein SGPRY_009201 [Prymnesium sp.]
MVEGEASRAGVSVEDGLSRLVEDRARELQLLRAVSAVQKRKQRPSLERELQALIGGGSRDSDEEERPRSTSEQATNTSNEINSLAASRRVSGITSAFRRSLESVFHSSPSASNQTRRSGGNASEAFSRPSLPANRRPRAQMGSRQAARFAQQEAAPLSSRVERSVLRESNQIARADEPGALAWPSPPPEAQPFRGSRSELGELRERATVGSRLRDPRFTERLERVLRARLSNRDDHQLRNRVLQSISEARAQHPSRQPREPSSAPAAVNPDLSGMSQLNMVTGATFELLLSVQRMLQQVVSHLPTRSLPTPLSLKTPRQELAAALHNNTAGAESAESARPPQAVRSVVHDTSRKKFALGACVVCSEAEVNTVFYKCGQ